MKNPISLSRRQFLKTSAVATVGALAYNQFAWAKGSDRIRVGLIGCGGRGSGAANDCCGAADGVELVAMGDLFKDHLDSARKNLQGSLKDKFKVTDDTAFLGFDAYQKVLASDVNLVILATPPGFRPIHFEAAIAAGKNVFMEKPVAVDPIGVRRVIATADIATKKKLAVVAGTQRRHQAAYLETVKRIHDGAIGGIAAAQCYWNQGGLWMNPRKPDWSDMEWQIRNWLYFTWLSGDHICEQHIHNLDVINWVMGTHPTKAYGMGGRQVRTAPEYGQIYDHFTIEYEYPNDVRTLSMCRQIDGTASRVNEYIVGTKGRSDPNGSITGEKNWKFEGQAPNPYVQEHTDLIASIRAGKPLNEGRRVAESTLTAIMGRMSAYTGQEVTWDFAMNQSKLDLSPPKYELGELPVPPVAVPGKDKLI